MASLDPELVRHALKTAQEHGFAEVELEVAGSSFRARIQPGAKKKSKPGGAADEKSPLNGEAEFKLVKSPIVGFYRVGPVPLESGKTIKKGDVVAVVNALGIANDVESQVAGEVAEVLIQDGQPVEFGQVLAKVKA